MFIITAAPPKRAATPTAPVFMGMAIPLLLELVPAPDALAPPAPLAVAVGLATAEDGVGMPLVNGALEALLAPEKAGFCVLADTFGVASGFRGFSTLGLISDVLVERDWKMVGLLVNHVDHAFFDKHIGNHNLRAVDEDIVAVNGHVDSAFGQGGEVLAIRKHSGVHDGVRNDVVAEYALELLHGYVGQS